MLMQFAPCNTVCCLSFFISFQLLSLLNSCELLRERGAAQLAQVPVGRRGGGGADLQLQHALHWNGASHLQLRLRVDSSDNRHDHGERTTIGRRLNHANTALRRAIERVCSIACRAIESKLSTTSVERIVNALRDSDGFDVDAACSVSSIQTAHLANNVGECAVCTC